MLKKVIMTLGVCVLPLAAQAGWMDVATAALGAQNGALLDQAQARLAQSQLEANAAVAQVNTTQVAENNNGVYSTKYLKTLDCTDLAVEAKAFERTLEAAQSNYAQGSALANNSVTKFAGLAGSALSAFAGQSTTAAKMSQVTNALTGGNSAQQTVNNAQQSAEVATVNLENIAIYQKAKKCNI